MKAIMRDEREMRDSGIEWIGAIPKHWSVMGFKKCIDNIVDYRGKTPEKVDSGRLLITAKNIKDGKINYGISQEFVKDEEFDEIMHRGIVNIGDVLFTTEAPLGQVANADRTDFALAQRIIKFSSKPDMMNNYFLKYWILSFGFQENLKRFATGSTATGIKASKLGMLKALVPTIDEQENIVIYLDDHCSKIDAIIAEAKDSIEEYKDLKISMVNDAITHGIKDNADIDSDIDWIGKIPANWRIMIMKRLFKIRKDIAGKEGYTVLSITQRGIVPKNFKDNGQFAADYSNYQLVNRGDFAMNHMDLLTGWVDISEYDGVTSPDYRVFVPTGYEEIYKPYYKYVMQNCYSCKIFYGLGHGVSGFGRWRLPKDMFLNFKVPLPPIEEQKEIASYIDNNLQKLDALISTKQSLIEDLESYKKSLIYEVVTGKRKVVE